MTENPFYLRCAVHKTVLKGEGEICFDIGFVHIYTAEKNSFVSQLINTKLDNQYFLTSLLILVFVF